MNLPFEPPLAPMLAKLQPEMPLGPEWSYEPKWDGFRAIVWRDGATTRITSRDKRPIERYFPELLEPLEAGLPDRCVVDGEIVIATEDGLDFGSLLQRIHPAESRVKLLASETPASYVAFDLLALDDASYLDRPMEERRRKLEELLPEGDPNQPPGRRQVLLTPQTQDPEEGRAWFEGLEALGLDGIIAKRAGTPYAPNKRTMIKVKHKRTADVVVGGYRLNKTRDGIGSLLLGVYGKDDNLQYVGHTSSFKAQERRDLLARLKEIEGGDSFGRGRTPGGPSRWAAQRETDWFPVEPILVCEVAYDYMQGDRFRHAAGFVRWRDDKAPTECTWDQLEA
ncbi:MAG TPA: ATP-dependent DNA ligase [Actinomycetota bacterium]|nr:ATP-dependent DNA ligase [Actinomycetota bacterium]